MDIFNRKRVKYLEEQLKLTSTKEAHLGWLYDEETVKRFVKELVEYI